MKSFIAALRTLVLPFGATSGRRIILDGVEGEIRVYDDTDVLRLLIGGLDNESIELSTGDSDETTRGRFFANVQDQGLPEEAPILWLISPALDGQTESFIALTGEAADSSAPADIRFFTDEMFVFADLLSLAAGARLLVAATGADDVEIEEGVIGINTDVNLYRGAANVLQTDDTFRSEVGMKINADIVPRMHSTVTTPKIQFGIAVVEVSAGGQTFTTAVTFDDAYSSTPVVLTGFNSSSGARAVEVEARSVSTTGFTATVRASAEVNFGGSANYNVAWCAIGTAPIP